MRKGTLIVRSDKSKEMKKGVTTGSMSTGPSALRASSVPLNDYAIKTMASGKEFENRLEHTALMTRVITARAEHVYENESGKCTIILQVLSGGPIEVHVEGKNARFSQPFPLEAGKLEESSKGGVYIWSFVGNHLVIEDALKVSVMLSNTAGPIPPTVYSVIQVSL